MKDPKRAWEGRWEELDQLVRAKSGAVESLRFEKPLRITCPRDSELPHELRRLGHDVRRQSSLSTQRINPIGRIEVIEQITESSSIPVRTTIHHPQIEQVDCFEVEPGKGT